MCWLLNLTNVLYFLGKKHCAFGPQVYTQLNPVGGGGRAHTQMPNEHSQVTRGWGGVGVGKLEPDPVASCLQLHFAFGVA